MCHLIHVIKIRISLEIVCGNLKVPVGTVGPEGLELPQQLLDAIAGPDDGGGDDDDDDGDDDGDDDDDCFGLPGENASYLWLGAHLKRQGL